MHAAEDDIVSFGTRGGLLRQLERVAAIIGVLDDLVALVVVSQDHQALAQFRPGCRDASIQFFPIHFRVRQGNRIDARGRALARTRGR